MIIKKLFILFLFVPLMTVFLPSAGANIVTYEFTVTGGDGPLGDVITQGYFSFDSSLQPLLPGQTFLLGQDLISNLQFTWNGFTYDETTANTGGLLFINSDSVTGILFGNNCPPESNGCIIQLELDHWSILIGFNSTEAGGNIEYSHSSEAGLFFSQITARQVPVPSSVLLLFSALTILAFSRPVT